MRVRKICQEYGLKEPEFKEIAQGFQVVLYKEKSNTTLSTDLKTDLKTDLTEELIIAAILADNKISISKIALEIGKGITVTKEYVNKLKTKGLIKRIGPAKGGHWEITK